MLSWRSILLVVVEVAEASASYFDGYDTVESPTAPIQIRLSYQGPTAMDVSWNTFEQLSQPSVRYGLIPDIQLLLFEASSESSVTYPTSLTYNNHVNITGLLPSTKYYYLPYGSNATTPYSFTTGRLAGDMTPFTVAVVVDMGTFGPLGLSDHEASDPLVPGQQTTIQAISEMLDEFDFVVHPGDIAYADAWLKEEIQDYIPTTSIEPGGALVYEHILNAFYDELENITSAKPYMVSPGNHDANCDNGGTTNSTSGVKYTEAICPVGQTNFTGYINHWRMPSGPSGGLGNFWYSFNHGMVHWVSIDTETDLGHGLRGPDEGSPEEAGPFGYYDQQINWLVNDLSSVNREITPWVIVQGHRPFYVSTDDNCVNCTEAFEDIFYQYGVDLYFSGHSHVYDRSDPTYHNVTDPNGLNNPKATWYIVNGAAGHYEGLDTLNSPLAPQTVFAEDTFYAWSSLTFHNCTHLTQSAYDSGTGQIFDSATLYKKRSCRFSWPL